MLKVENVATPFTAGTVAVPDSVPLPGLLPIATVTLPVKPVAVVPSPSCAVTRTPGAIAARAIARRRAVHGPRAGVPGATVNRVLVAPVRPPGAAARV